MKQILPSYLSSQYTVTHNDLIKFGLDSTKKAIQASPSGTSSVNFSVSHCYLEYPAIFFANFPDEVIVIRRKKRKGTESKSVIVDKKTGVMAKNKEFLDIYKFDQQTFPDNEEEVDISHVGYWKRNKQYVSKRKSNER